MALYADSLPLREARQLYFDNNDFGPDGGYGERWVKFKVGPLPLAFPNFAARRRVVRYHDLNHLATEYRTNLLGEALIGAFEVGAGCGRYLTAWGFNLSAFSWGVWLAPRRSLRAFARGRRSRSLYHRDLDERILGATVGHLRDTMQLAEEPTETSNAERWAFAVWVGIAWASMALGLAVLLTPLALLVAAVTAIAAA